MSETTCMYCAHFSLILYQGLTKHFSQKKMFGVPQKKCPVLNRNVLGLLGIMKHKHKTKNAYVVSLIHHSPLCVPFHHCLL